ncbi:MAG TPA: hypothetical protein VKT28_19375 [Puia sp.]|nr:hypothetical protein [Puia sp.]
MPILLLFSCGQAINKKTVADKSKFQTTTIEVNISNNPCLAILLAKDGTINRNGSGVIDSVDKDLFMGITEEKVFDSLMQTVSDDLLSYCGQTYLNCDTTKQTYKVTVSFSDNKSDIGFEYCVNGTQDDIPKPISEYIMNAIKITDPWFQTQKKLTDKK